MAETCVVKGAYRAWKGRGRRQNFLTELKAGLSPIAMQEIFETVSIV
jgi:hypothetical protein